MTGEINDTLFAEVYCFSGEVGDEIVIDMVATSGNLDPLLFLSDTNTESPERFASNDDISDEDRNSQIVFTLPVSGNFIIFATRFNAEDGATSGAFELALARTNEPVSTGCPSDLEPIASGDLRTSNISDATPFRLYCFVGLEGDEVTIDAMARSGDLDPLLLLSDVDIEEFFADNDDASRGTRDAQIIFTLPTDGPYVIAVTRFNGSDGVTSGTFDLTLNVVRACDPQLVRGEWILLSDTDDFVLDFECDDVVNIQFNKDQSTTTYSFTGDVIEIQLSDGTITFTEVVIVEDIMGGNVDGTALLFVNSESGIDDITPSATATPGKQ
ncbi:MAG: hypothetical protein CUN54_02645 [Phototrophicales bacterium]|nr:MAG: hypothetical protein CUN54_02645 [Phototrophicales bacterium]